MNSVSLVGRLTKDPELRYTNSNKAYTRFTLAVNRSFTKEDGTREADFISCVAWDKRAEAICKYVKKGHQFGLDGRIQTSKAEREDGTTIYMTDVIVSEIHFLQSKLKDDLPEPEYGEKTSKEETVEEDPFASFGEKLNTEDYPFDVN